MPNDNRKSSHAKRAARATVGLVLEGQSWASTQDQSLRLGYSLGTTLRNATNATYMTVQAKRASQGFIGQAERTRGTSLNYGYISFCTSKTLRSAPLSL